MNITVYLGSTYGNDPDFKTKIIELGTWIAKNNHTLVFGGSKTGLMGELANSTLNAGGKVIGVEAQMFVDNLTKLYIEKNIADRRTRMIELGDVFIAFPGATGTLEEISEILSKLSLYQLECPCIFYNVNGYYDHLKAFLQHMIDCELSTIKKQQYVYFLDSLNEIKEVLKEAQSWFIQLLLTPH